jgi:hypothetical protein
MESLRFHPMGLLILGLFLFIAGQSLMPKAYQQRISEFIEQRSVFFKALYVTFVAAFLGFAAFRAMGELTAMLLR